MSVAVRQVSAKDSRERPTQAAKSACLNCLGQVSSSTKIGHELSVFVRVNEVGLTIRFPEILA